MRGSKMFCQRGSNFDNVCFYWCLFFDEGRLDPNSTKKITIIGPPAKRHLNGVSLACR